MQVRVALTVSVADEIDRHAVDGEREVAPVIYVEAPQEVLAGLAPARVLDHEQAGGDLEDVGRSRVWAQQEVLITHGHGRRCCHGPPRRHHGLIRRRLGRTHEYQESDDPHRSGVAQPPQDFGGWPHPAVRGPPSS